MTPTERLRRANIHEWVTRTQTLHMKGVSVAAAEVVVDAAMFGVGCTEGRVREDQQRRIDAGEDL